MRLLNAIALLGAALLCQSCGGAAEVDAPVEAKPAKLITLAENSNVNSNSLPAVIRSVRSTDLAFQVSGQITQWNALGGRYYRKGEVIAALDPRTFRNAVAQAQAQYLNAESEYQRALRLIEEDAISQSVVESRLAQRQVAQAVLDDARKNLSDATLRAPFSGYIGRTYVEQFQNVQAQAPVVAMQSSDVEALVNVPGSFVLNSSRTRFSNNYVVLDAAKGRRFPAVFREATGQADQSTQTFEARFTFNAPRDLLVLTGMTATLYFDSVLEGEETANESDIAVPLSSVISEGPKKYVLVVKPVEKTVSRREIVVVEDGVGDTVQVSDGLRIGETIVAAGGAYLKEGDRVRQWDR